MGYVTVFPSRKSPSRSDDAESIDTLKGPQTAAREPEHPPAGSRFPLRAVKHTTPSNRRTARKVSRPPGTAWGIVDDLPEDIPVKDMEIGAIETYFGRWMDEI